MGQVFTCGYYLCNRRYNIPVGEMYLHARMFCALTHMSSIPMGAINFYMQELFFTLADTTSILMFAKYLHARMFCTLAPYVFYFPWVQCQSLKPVLRKCSQTCFLTVDDFIALYTRSYVFYSHGCINFYIQEYFVVHSIIRLPKFLP